MSISNMKGWEEYVTQNTDDYGKACVDVARRVMEILDGLVGSLERYSPHKIICQADKDVKAGGITGYMAGAVAHMVSSCHSRGEEFRKIWNADHDYEGEGIVNPALLTINLPAEGEN